MKRYGLRKLYHVHRVYDRRERIQKLSKYKSNTFSNPLKNYSGRERNGGKGLTRKITTTIAGELKEAEQSLKT